MSLFATATTAEAMTEKQYDQLRNVMVTTQIESRGVSDPAVLKSMREVPRHLFVPTTIRARAYEDRPLSIGEGQTISQPYIVALMTQLLDVQPEDKVLEVGTGSGYQAAVLSPLVKEVYTIEIVESLGLVAEQVLKENGYGNVQVRIGDGYEGWPEEAPFDAIIVTAAPPSIPQALIEQLKPGGRMVIPVGLRTATQELLVVEKDENSNVTKKRAELVRFVPMVRKSS